MPIIGACHCGDVKFELHDTPELATDCNCSICRKLGALWVHSEIENITILSSSDKTIRYIRSQANIAFHSCGTCGCTTHWENLKPDKASLMAINIKLTSQDNLRIRHF